MARYTRTQWTTGGMILGGIAWLFMQFKAVRILVFVALAYVSCLFLYDTLFTEHTLPDNDSSGYEFQVTDVKVPDLVFSRDNPQFTVTGHLTNKLPYTIQRWILQGKLYDCPVAFAPITQCQYVTQWSTYVDADLEAGQTQQFTKVVDFWNGDHTHGQLRAVWSINSVSTDRDSHTWQWVKDQRAENERQLAAYRAL